MSGWRAWPSPRGAGGRGRDGGDNRRNSWKPPPHSQSAGLVNFSIPLWEKKFCSDVCMIPWKLLSENQKFIGVYKNVLEWDDSAALEAFQNAKTRFWAQYHGFFCDIPLPDPEMYIDEVDSCGSVDPDLVADLEGRISLPRYENVVSSNNCLVMTDTVAATGWEDAENNITDNTCGDLPLVNWDVYAEQQTRTPTWGDRIVPNSCWDVKNDSTDAWNTETSKWDASVRLDASCGSRRNCYGNNNAGGNDNLLSGPIQDDPWNIRRNRYTSNYTGGWGPGATENNSWRKGRNNSENHGMNNSHGYDEAATQDYLYGTQRINHVYNGRGMSEAWENSNCESGRTYYGRKRYAGGWAGSRANKMRYQNRVY